MSDLQASHARHATVVGALSSWFEIQLEDGRLLTLRQHPDPCQAGDLGIAVYVGSSKGGWWVFAPNTRAACDYGNHFNCSGWVHYGWLPWKRKKQPCACSCHSHGAER